MAASTSSPTSAALVSAQEREEIIKRYRPLVERIARQMLVRLPANVTLDDLVGAGALGLVEAVDRFDPAKQVSFAAFARMRIKGAMLDELRDLDMLPRSVRNKADELERCQRDLQRQLGRRPTCNELSEAMGMSLRQYEKLRQKISAGSVVGFDDVGQIGEDGVARHFIDTVADEALTSSEMLVRASEVRDEVVRAIERIPERWQLVLRMYYVEDLNMREIAALLSVTEGRISQLHSAAIKALRKHLSDDVDPEEVRLALRA